MYTSLNLDTPPSTAQALSDMKAQGITRAVALSMYPQYSCSTTGSSLNELHKESKLIDPSNSIKWSTIDRWPTNLGLVESFVRKIKNSLLEYPQEERNSVVLLFSAHSLPMSVVDRGDPYPQEVAATVQQVMKSLNFSNPYRLCWQSQVGPRPWLGPKTESSIINYGKMGQKNLLLIPIAFVSDHIETLYELDIEYGKLAKENGVVGYKRCESLNDDGGFLDALSKLVQDHVEDNVSCSVQLGLRCPGCVNPKCQPTKDFFKNQLIL